MSIEELKAKGYTDDEINEIIMVYENEMQYEDTDDEIDDDDYDWEAEIILGKHPFLEPWDI